MADQGAAAAAATSEAPDKSPAPAPSSPEQSAAAAAAAPSSPEQSVPAAAATTAAAGPAATTAADPAEDQPAPLVAAVLDDGDEQYDSDSAFGGDLASSTASISSSILEYRNILGRTFHSDRHNTQYFTPNDNRQGESLEIVHHYLTLLLGGRLHHAPIKDDVQRVIDIGTGTGIWAVDFGDEHPSADVTGTDLSPMQPTWVPPNVRFEIEDATQPWTFADDHFDFIHIRYFAGAVNDWDALFREAYRCCKPGGYVESCEFDPRYYCDDGTADGDETLKLWAKVFEDGGAKIGNTFRVIELGIQDAGIKAAGFEEVKGITYKCPVGPWTSDRDLNEVGKYVQLCLENDMEGYTLFLWTTVLGWTREEHIVFLAQMRKVLRDRKKHIYINTRYVYGRKPGGPADS